MYFPRFFRWVFDPERLPLFFFSGVSVTDAVAVSSMIRSSSGFDFFFDKDPLGLPLFRFAGVSPAGVSSVGVASAAAVHLSSVSLSLSSGLFFFLDNDPFGRPLPRFGGSGVVVAGGGVDSVVFVVASFGVLSGKSGTLEVATKSFDIWLKEDPC